MANIYYFRGQCTRAHPHKFDRVVNLGSILCPVAQKSECFHVLHGVRVLLCNKTDRCVLEIEQQMNNYSDSIAYISEIHWPSLINSHTQHYSSYLRTLQLRSSVNGATLYSKCRYATS